jgi:hypothetical protein
MKDSLLTRSATSCLLVAAVVCGQALAQGYDTPLTIQGLDRATLPSAASRGAGGITIGIKNDVSLMFGNPAALVSLTGPQFSLGAVQQFTDAKQKQEYGPLKYYSNFSLLMEGRTDEIPDPDSLGPNPNAGDSVQRPYDTISPNWSHAKDRALPLQALLAVPFSIGEAGFVAGAGAVQYADLNHYYQNNNVLTPSILSIRPLPVVRPPNDSLPTLTQWSQYTRSREGTLRGYGVALAGEVPGVDIALGVSGMILDGSTDDFEQRIARGRLTFYTQWFRLDSVYSRSTSTGTSDYSGKEFTFSGIYRGRSVSVGFAVKPPTTITRTYTTQVSVDTTGTPIASTVSGEDKLKLPWRGMLGLSITLAQNLVVGLEYEIRSYESAVYTQSDNTVTHPWLSASVLHGGVEYMPASWLALRAGVRGQAEVFEPEGNPVAGEPVTSSVYSAGCGFFYSGFRLNLTYEYAMLNYQDVWGSAISLNTDTRHTLVADLAYELPSLW